MQPIPFPEQNTVIAEHQKEYLPLPAYVSDNPIGQIICRISVSPEEIKQIQETGGFYFSMQCGRTEDGRLRPVTPIMCFTESPFRSVEILEDISASSLFGHLKAGVKMGNTKIGRDIILFEIVNVSGENIVYKLLRPDNAHVIATHMKTFTEFSTLLHEIEHTKDWFIIQP